MTRMKQAVVLLIEDDPGDQELTRRALDDGVVKMDLRIVNDGVEALDYLYRRNGYSDAAAAPRPDLILLDLNMPKLDGRAVLKELREVEDLQPIPVVVMTTSDQEADILRSYKLGCNSFITKPVEMDGFIATLRELGHYWFELVALPPH